MFVEVIDGDPTICTVLVSINLRLFQMGKRKKSLKKVVKKTVAKLAVVFNCPKCSYPKCCKCTM